MDKNCGVLFLSWPEAFQAGLEKVGGKGWNLGRLERYGFRVPSGGVLSARVFQDFIESNHLQETIDKIKRSITLNNIEGKEIKTSLVQIREEIKAGSFSSCIREELINGLKKTQIFYKSLAVRSSATTEDNVGGSFAGIHDSFLNVQGIDNILSAIKGCYASLWTLRAVAYRRKMKVSDDEVIPAVVIMEMVQAEAAGVGFTCDPRNGREDNLIISANFGLGESVVSGTVEPDEYRLDYRCEITEKRIGRKEGKIIAGINGGTEYVESPKPLVSQALKNGNIRELGFQIQRVYEALGCGEQHQDIEWVFDGQDFYLVQARPVTALPRYTCAGIKDQPDIWSNSNIRDGMPMVQSTLNWSLMKNDLNSMFKEPLRVIGFPVPPGLQQVRLYQGRAYFNLSVQQWLLYDALGIKPSATKDTFGGYQPEISIKEDKPYKGIKGLNRLIRLLKMIYISPKKKKKGQNTFVKVDTFTKALLKENYKGLTEIELEMKINEIRNLLREFALLFIFCASFSMNSLQKTLEKYFPGKGIAMANSLMTGEGDITSAQHGYRLLEMANIAREDPIARRFFSSVNFDPLLWEKELPESSSFKRLVRSFIEEYGHRGVYEMDIINPRWREDPSYLLNYIRNTMENTDLSKIQARQKEKAGAAWQEIKQKIPFYRLVLIRNLLKEALKAAELREMAKSVLAKIFESERIIFQKVGRLLTDREIIAEHDDIFHCSLNEIISILKGYWDGRGLRILIDERKARRKEMETLSPPDLIIGETPTFAESVTYSSGNELSGLGVATGKASGAAKLVYHPHEGEKLQAGDVLVAPSTDPGWTPLFLKAAAIVMETGGFLSHGAIVAREYGVPAVVNVPGVMKMLKDSQSITVDGDEGKIYLTKS